MNYRRLGNSGLKLSELSFGSWVTYGAQLGDDTARECMAAAHDAGVNFFDNAEVYAKGKSETIMGNVLKKLAWRRESYVVSTKFFWGLNDGPNEKNTLNRKYLMQAIDASLRRLQLDHVDLVFCHRADPDTPIEETVWAMHDMIRVRKGALLGNIGVERRRDHGRLADRGATPPRQAGDGAAAVQPVPSRARGERICAPVSRYRTRNHDLEPSRVRTLERQVQRWHPRGLARRAQGLRVAVRADPRSGPAEAGPPSGPARRRSRAARCRSSRSPGA